MTNAPPIPTTWDGESFIPLPRFARICDKHFVVGETYPLVVQEERSAASHRRYFAEINDAWHNLREDVADQFASPDHLRKWALCKAGYADERSIVCASKAEAQRVAAFVKPMDEFAIVLVRDATVRVYTAQSQSMKAMGRQAFQDSKAKVLDIVARMIGVKPAELARNEAA